MSDTSKKKQFSFNVFDVFIILLAVALIATVVYNVLQNSYKTATEDNPRYVMEFECESEYDSLAKYIKEGDEVYIKSNGELIGYIRKSDMMSTDAIVVVDKGTQDSTEEPTDEPAQNVSGKAEYDDLYKKVTFSGEMKLNGNTQKSRDGSYYSIEDFNITVGSKIEVYTDNAQFTITVKAINDIK